MPSAPSLSGKVLLGEAAAMEDDSESRSEGSSPAFAGSSECEMWGVVVGSPPSSTGLPIPVLGCQERSQDVLETALLSSFNCAAFWGGRLRRLPRSAQKAWSAGVPRQSTSGSTWGDKVLV